MRIGILTPSIYMYRKLYSDRIFAPYGLAQQLVTGLVNRGHEVIWFTAPDVTQAHLESGDIGLLEKNLQIRVMQDINPEIKDRMSLFLSKCYYEMDLVEKAFIMVQAGKLDILHSYHTTLYAAHFFEELTGFPVLYTLHDPIPTEDMHETWLINRFPTHRFLSISLSQRGKFAKYFFDNVYHGIDTQEFAFSPQTGDHFISVGRMTPDKGFTTAIDVVLQTGEKLAIATWLTDNVLNSEYYQKNILPKVDGTQIKISSLLKSNERINFFQNAKALLFPLQWEEPFGMIMIEAMSCGTPVIAYNRGSVAELVRDGVTGFIIDPDSQNRPGMGSWVIKKQGIEGLVEAVKRIGEIDRGQCRKHIEDNFSEENMVKGYERVYQKLLNEIKYE